MRMAKLLSGIVFLVLALSPAGLAAKALVNENWFYDLQPWQVRTIAFGLVLCALALVATGTILIVRRGALFTAGTTSRLSGILAMSILFWMASFQYLMARSMIGVRLLLEEVKKVDAVIEKGIYPAQGN
jgi:hypothetical protein